MAAATVIGVIGISGTAYAANLKTPAEITASLTGKTITEVTQERTNGKTYGTIASEAGKLDEFQAQMLEQKKALLDSQVKNGQLTQQQADSILDTIKNNMTLCDGTGSGRLGRTYGIGNNGFAKGRGRGMGMGMGRNASGLGNGICYGTGVGSGINQ